MKYWLIVFLFDVDDQFLAKDVYESANYEQCQQFASDYARKMINTSTKAQFHCVSDDHYMGRSQDEGVDYD